MTATGKRANDSPSKAKADGEPPVKKIAADGEETVVDLFVDEAFGVSPAAVYEVLTNGEKYGEALGTAVWKGNLEVGNDWIAGDGFCRYKILHLVPNKLIVQEWRLEDWEPSVPSSTVVTTISPRPHGGARVVLNHINVPSKDAERLQAGWVDFVYKAIRAYLKDEKNARPPRTGRNLCHVEIPAKDADRAGKFYADVFGWNVSKWAEEYVGFSSGPRNSEWGWVDGGFPQQNTKPIADHEKVASPTLYFDAKPIEEFEKKVVAAGGKVLKPKHKTYYGTIAECQDTEGNFIVLYEM
ncbi:uncharacterized protein SPPG_00898 [Spizellomyces punctatus DAOM BR117]|uniref:VOC domain-containing protein n=1 Tax=Spizellomyces punctatus (strain DAOM BR117) TaxID=645134 RepID=A0A0L0HQM8_SPIPD|nr:uncharacterized protein SPPG_00898 [Spizellomyces punctatus DAOM BR117]KND03412.1 hypothetical protein SPPG_00898 [Spizellomyces punctatus DAOM BR117]|eukprot:XP_016611451.1 hypothetical protein SPPG_00898 [Spizellomyces punctatus DAOM BR117]